MPSPSSANPLQNQLLASLPLQVRERLFPLLEHCRLAHGKVLYESRGRITHVYFPTDAIVSLLYETTNGDSAEVSLIGNEGVVGVSKFLGVNISLTRAVVLIAGNAYRLPTQAGMAEFDRHTELMSRVLLYAGTLMAQIGQTAVCTRHHTVEQQLCCWLLLALDRVPTGELNMTQEVIANMLGVRRERVTLAAGKLQKMGVIEYSRGHIRLRDRKALERLSCECYRMVQTETARLSTKDVPLAHLKTSYYRNRENPPLRRLPGCE